MLYIHTLYWVSYYSKTLISPAPFFPPIIDVIIKILKDVENPPSRFLLQIRKTLFSTFHCCPPPNHTLTLPQRVEKRKEKFSISPNRNDNGPISFHELSISSSFFLSRYFRLSCSPPPLRFRPFMSCELKFLAD